MTSPNPLHALLNAQLLLRLHAHKGWLPVRELGHQDNLAAGRLVRGELAAYLTHGTHVTLTAEGRTAARALAKLTPPPPPKGTPRA